MNAKGRWKGFVVAALASAVASVLVVAVGPSFSQGEDAATTALEEQTATEGSEDLVASTSADGPGKSAEAPGRTDDAIERSTESTSTTSSTASTTPDSHGHIGAGTGTTTGSQADPGHKDDRNGTDGLTNGPGTGDSPATDCTNPHQGADEPQGGANYNPGPYDNTCDGRISQNGQGDDAAGKGTPCAGCVGNADDKNPPGQVREWNGTKPNDMGYECDGNQGVGAHYGNGNPAHTGDCATPPPCLVDMNPDVDGVQCTPPCLVDMNPDVDGVQCTPPCLVDMNPDVDGVQCTPPCLVDMNPDVDGVQCHPPCPTDMNPDEPGKQCTPPCLVDMNPDVDGVQCTPPCLVDMNPDVDGVQCTPPGPCVDDMNTPQDECHPPCPTDMNPDEPGKQCTPPTPCVDDMSTEQDECDSDQLCPEGTEMAGEPIPSGGVAACDDDVLGDTIDNDGDLDGDTGPDVLGGREGPDDRGAQGAVLPFTGTSVIAYVLLGLQMIGAGALIARARKRK